MTPAPNDWTDEFYPPDAFVKADTSPAEIADQLSPQARQSLVDEAKRVFRDAEDWTVRRSRFLRWYDRSISQWFG